MTLAWIYRTYGPGIDEPLAEWRASSGRISYLVHDALGSVTVVTDVNGNVAYRSSYSAFGNLTRGTWDDATTRMAFTGREVAVGGLMQYRSRYYDPGTGRFLQQDTYQGDATAPPSLHRYVYTLDSPPNFTDPYGHWVQLAGQIGVTAIALVMIMGLMDLTTTAILWNVDFPEDSVNRESVDFAKDFWRGVGRDMMFVGGVLYYLAENLAHSFHAVHAIKGLGTFLGAVGFGIDYALFTRDAVTILRAKHVSSDVKSDVVVAMIGMLLLGVMTFVGCAATLNGSLLWPGALSYIIMIETMRIIFFEPVIERIKEGEEVTGWS